MRMWPGYSRLTGEDEDATHRRLSEYLDLITATVEANRGRVLHYAGDAVLAMFDAVVDAVACAVEVQGTLGERNQELPKRERKPRHGHAGRTPERAGRTEMGQPALLEPQITSPFCGGN